MLSVFRDIELVSLILRFVKPKNFGMWTPPVASILALPSSMNAVETYLNYLHNVRSIRDKCGFAKVADADKALWVLSQKCNDSGRAKDDKIKAEFKKDDFMLQLRASNIAPSFKSYARDAPARLAKALYDDTEDDNHLAMLVGGYALEKNVQKWVKYEGVGDAAKKIAKNKPNERSSSKPNPKPMLEDYINALKENKHKLPISLGAEIFEKLHDLRKLRNDVFHAKPEPRNANKFNELIKPMLKIENFLNSKQSKQT